jgi:hypothetical protein
MSASSVPRPSSVICRNFFTSAVLRLTLESRAFSSASPVEGVNEVQGERIPFVWEQLFVLASSPAYLVSQERGYFPSEVAFAPVPALQLEHGPGPPAEDRFKTINRHRLHATSQFSKPQVKIIPSNETKHLRFLCP